MGDWVRYKLDRAGRSCAGRRSAGHQRRAVGHHRANWSRNISAARAKAEERHRTLFMVGDLKQAIYGFQGTDPKRFEQAREEFRRARRRASRSEDTLDLSAADARLRDLSIAASFRSAQPVLDVVDAVIDELGPEALALGGGLRRTLLPRTGGARSSCGSRSRREFDDEGDEGEERGSIRATAICGRACGADSRAGRGGSVAASTERPLTPGDILVLVRSRGELASLSSRGCSRRAFRWRASIGFTFTSRWRSRTCSPR